MREKEKLLSFDCKIRFIFSHSALKEGWDNPNVFQICTLNETKSTIKKRQEIGRGLRLCVNQAGERQYEPGLNILTVMANESYDEFADSLQKEYEEDGIRFRVLEVANFANIPLTPEKEQEEPRYLGTAQAKKSWKVSCQLRRLEKTISGMDLLLLDELSYARFGQEESELLFKVIAERSERSSTMITTNLEFSK